MAGIEVASGILVKIQSRTKEVDLTIEMIVDIVNEIQNTVYDQTETEYFDVTVLSNGYVHIIEFIGIQIWNSDDDDRRYIEVGDMPDGMPDEIHEPLDVYLKRNIMAEIAKMKKISL